MSSALIFISEKFNLSDNSGGLLGDEDSPVPKVGAHGGEGGGGGVG